MTYHWNTESITNVLALPTEVVDKHIRLAGAAQLKVLLWFARTGIGVFDAAACSAAVGISAADCADALQYWVETGLLTADGIAASVAAPLETPRPVTSVAKEATATVEVTPPPKRPQVRDVIRRQKGDSDFTYLLNQVSARLGRPITNADMTTLLYLYDTSGLPTEVILTITAYAVANEKPNLRYIEKVAFSWAEQGITTMAAAEEYLCRLDRRQQAWAKLETILGIHRTPTVGQLDRAEQWIAEWQLDEGLIRKAYESCLEKTGKLQLTYMARILEGWRADGIKTVEQVENERTGGKKNRPPKIENTSLDTQAYEQMVEQFVPIFPAGGKKE